MNLNSLGLGLIITLEALLRLRNITRAAAEIHQSRPAVSGALRRLREILGDELLVPNGRELMLTPLGAMLLEPTQAILLQARAAYAQDKFDCRTSTRTFTLLADEQSLELCLPDINRAFTIAAPRARLNLGLLRREGMERFSRGEIDLLLGPDSVMAPIHPSCLLYQEDWVIVVWTGNARYGPAPTLDDLRAARHVIRETHGQWFDHSPLDIAIQVPTYRMMIPAILESDLMGIVPRRIGEKFAADHRLKLLVHPDPPRDIRHCLQWHRHRDSDAGVNWFRRLSAGLPVFAHQQA